jgi:hypothetical protein
MSPQRCGSFKVQSFKVQGKPGHQVAVVPVVLPETLNLERWNLE